jgi:hypothetical protein
MEVRMVEDALDHGGDEEGALHSIALHQAQPFIGAEARLNHHCGAGIETAQHRQRSADMEDRHAHHRNGRPRVGLERRRIGKSPPRKDPLGNRYRLGQPGRAAGEDDHRGVVVGALDFDILRIAEVALAYHSRGQRL